MCILLYEKVSWARILFCLLLLLLLAVVIAAAIRYVVVSPVGVCRIVCCSPARPSICPIESSDGTRLTSFLQLLSQVP